MMKFTGLAPSKSKYISDSPKILGEPCIYQGHYTEQHGFREGPTLACLDCLERLKDPRIDLSMDRLKKEAIRRALGFWSKVDITDIDDCWKYNGKYHKGRGMTYVWPRNRLYTSFRHHPTRIAVWLAWGDLGMMPTVSLCGERRCVNPLHNIPSCIDPSIYKKIDREDLTNQVEELKTKVFEKAQSKALTKKNLILPNASWKLQRQLEIEEELDEMDLLLPYHKARHEAIKLLKEGSV